MARRDGTAKTDAKEPRMSFASGLPLTKAEIEACRSGRKQVRAKEAARRRVCPNLEHYNQPADDGIRRRDRRIMGESEE